MSSFRSVYDYHYLPLKEDDLFTGPKDKGDVSYVDLIITKGNKRRKTWIIGGLIFLIVIAIVIAASVLFSGDKANTLRFSQNLPAITLEDVLEGRMNAEALNATWISGHELIYKNSIGSIMKYDVVKRSSQELLPASHPILLTAFEHELSPDKKYLLIAHDYQKLYRYSYVAQYTIVNLETKNTSKVLANDQPILQFATWSPVGNSIVYVAQFNIFYRPSADSEVYKEITTDGLQGHIHNGVADWVYEEEVFSTNRAVWFSKDGKKLAYARFNDTKVSVMNIPVYGQPGSYEFQYPRGIQIRYPKPGTRNPTLTLHVVNLHAEADHLTLNPPEQFKEEAILSTVAWATNDIVTAIWMNRIQDEAEIATYATTTMPPQKVVILSLKEPRGWLELFTPPIFSKTGNDMLLILSQKQENSIDTFRHVTILPRTPNAVTKSLTKGNFVVTKILGWDELHELIYYQATTEKDPALQHIYSISTKTSAVKCLSCSVKTDSRNTDCLYNTAEFSTDNSHYVLQCSGPDVPEISVFNATAHKLLVWDQNKHLLEFVRDKAIPKIKRMEFNVTGGFKAQVLLKLPPNIDMSGNTKYPMLVHVYGGPDSYQVVERFPMDWGSYLAGNKSIIYAMIDARGSGLKGDRMLFSVYKKLGTVEIIDQINVTRQIQRTLPYVDISRTAIWGWSYGGYAAGMALATDVQNVFKCGISVAPVTDWALYDSIYTERFMDIPANNSEAYVKARLLNKYEGIRNKEYYLIHGTLDDNVHYQQSMLWSKVLEEHDILFRQQSYPDEDHGLNRVRPHLYHSLENFLDQCFVVERSR